MEKLLEHITYIGKLLTRIVESWNIKLLTGVGLSVVTFLFDALQRDALLALLILIIMDFFTALLAAYKTGESVQSAKIFRTALKITVYFGLVSSGFVAEKAIPIGIIDEILLGFLVVTELISILENVSKAGYATPTGLLNTLKDYKNKK